ncbi:MAG: 3-oxoacyl-[acyl-carrier-protein] reductase [Candidatus Competibacteraceae bacterium]|jgi:acetoacetyl-CoA reductase|nr:3-oxoacyl-[acyl-carrier-protein] reductase [Candidatus Competibacteraceae bacterium]
MGKLTDKIALVTGGSRGIGKSIALELAREGAKVALNYRSSAAEAQATADEIKALGSDAFVAQGDVGESAQARNLVKQVLDHYGTIDILVNNAGITRDMFFKKLTDEAWHEVIKTNLDSVFYVTSATLPSMLEKNYGRIISISSFVGQKGNLAQTNYAATKAGLIGFSKSLALETAKNNVTVNTINPGFIATDMVLSIREDVQQKLIDQVPLRRFGTPEEVAKAVIFLAADGDYITGQQINVNGGIYM